MTTIKKKVVVVGDGACGKTCLAIGITKNPFPKYYTPTEFDTYTVTAKLDMNLVRFMFQYLQ